MNLKTTYRMVINLCQFYLFLRGVSSLLNWGENNNISYYYYNTILAILKIFLATFWQQKIKTA